MIDEENIDIKFPGASQRVGSKARAQSRKSDSSCSRISAEFTRVAFVCTFLPVFSELKPQSLYILMEKGKKKKLALFQEPLPLKNVEIFPSSQADTCVFLPEPLEPLEHHCFETL